MPYTTVNRVELFHEDRGSGQPLILLHGWGTNGQVWSAQAEEFAGAYRVVVPDWRGCGRSARPGGGDTIAGHAQDVLALAEALELDRPVLVGVSARPGGIRLPNPVNEGVFRTSTGKALFSRNTWQMPLAPEGHLLLQTLRSHDQWNTIPYTADDRYRGIHGSRQVVLVNPEDVAGLGLTAGQRVDLVSVWANGEERRAAGFEVVPYPSARGCAAAYYPETNVLVPLDSVAEGSNQPTSKALVVRLEPVGAS
ncbi:hypothetical protein AN220_01710 [Streptomyces nanshensis]|nr:hypothetical protein AN220_01710 [Streptomyces nanshensis]